MKYHFGDRALNGFVRQQINKDGELSYKGLIHLFGTQVPIYLSIEPMDKYVKGEKVYKVLTYLSPMPYEKKGSWVQVALGEGSRKRLKAIKKVKEIVSKLGVAYEYQKRNEEKIQNEKCRHCKAAIKREWQERLRTAVESNVKRQREIRDRKIQRLLANRKRNKRNAN
jgi:hypothetical protein